MLTYIHGYLVWWAGVFRWTVQYSVQDAIDDEWSWVVTWVIMSNMSDQWWVIMSSNMSDRCHAVPHSRFFTVIVYNVITCVRACITCITSVIEKKELSLTNHQGREQQAYNSLMHRQHKVTSKADKPLSKELECSWLWNSWFELTHS